MAGMLNSAQIRIMVGELVLSRISLDDFEDWLVGASWNMHQNPEIDAETKRLVGAIELNVSQIVIHRGLLMKCSPL